jgi:hypothetical protein
VGLDEDNQAADSVYKGSACSVLRTRYSTPTQIFKYTDILFSALPYGL